MTKTLISTLLASMIALPALAQVAPPAGPYAPPVDNAIIAHHDRLVARSAARHGNWRKAAVANQDANVARSEVPPRY